VCALRARARTMATLGSADNDDGGSSSGGAKVGFDSVVRVWMFCHILCVRFALCMCVCVCVCVNAHRKRDYCCVPRVSRVCENACVL